MALAFGGNKVRLLEYYPGDVLAKGAGTVLIVSAVQSNFTRLTAAACLVWDGGADRGQFALCIHIGGTTALFAFGEAVFGAG